jgi:hypothetical protein
VSKYHAQRTAVGDQVFDSKREARRWVELQILQRAGAIVALERQVPYVLYAPGLESADAGELAIVGRWIADFRYRERGQVVIEDAKGVRTAVYRLKKRLVEATYGIRIVEV